ncbi:hypothetical protein [Oceaniradius stylonematis]|uniref:hypothetical protein n=1 Tax=Oceaniradius stylonematis TaxID=2184161 RepID=UPI00273E403A|nr:hypothetical protein [Oceaniradius stylonematis]
MPNAPKTAPVHNLRTQIPDPAIPLLEAGEKVYREWCERLIEIGGLTSIAREHIENLAIATDEIHLRREQGKVLPRATMELRRSATLKLEKIVGDVRDSPQGASPKGENPWAPFGFAKRARDARHG